MRKSMYLKLQLKRSAKLYPSILIVTLVTLLSIVLTAGALLYTNKNDDSKTKLKLGIVGDTSESYLGVGIMALQNLDSSRFSIEFLEMDENSAQKALSSHEISGYLRIPDNFISGILYGDNIPVDYVVLNDSTGFETIIMREIADIVSEWITRTQSSASSFEEISSKYGTAEDKRNYGKNIEKLNVMYITNVLGRSSVYETHSLGIADMISTEGYYICGIIIFFLLIWGISCNKLLIKNNFALSRSLCSRGIKSTLQILCEYAGFLMCTVATLLLFATSFGIIVNNNSFGVRELEDSTLFSSIFFIIKILPVVIMITMMQMMLYELVPGTVNSIVLLFFTAVVLAYISGCFYPNYFFPDSIQKTASLLPSGVGFSYLRKTLSGMPVTREYVTTIMYTVLFTAATVLIRKQRMAGDER